MTINYTWGQILQLLEISTPYFAFDEISEQNGTVSAFIPAEQPMGLEKHPITASEATRHLSVLSIFSCSLQNPVKLKHYYIPYNIIYQNTETEKQSTHENTEPEILKGKASCISVDYMTAHAEAEITDQIGRTIIKISFYYHVIPENIFKKLYRDHHNPKPDFKSGNPYAVVHPFSKQQFSYNTMTCSMGYIPEYMCAGHYAEYPALPVPMLIYNLTDLTNRLISMIEGKFEIKTTVKSFTINIENLAFAGDKVDLLSTCISHDSKGIYEVSAEGIANLEKSVGKMNIVLQKVSEAQIKDIGKKISAGSIIRSVVKSLSFASFSL